MQSKIAIITKIELSLVNELLISRSAPLRHEATFDIDGVPTSSVLAHRG